MRKEVLTGAVLDLHKRGEVAESTTLAESATGLINTALRVKDERDGAVGLLRKVLMTGASWREQAEIHAEIETFLRTMGVKTLRLPAAARFERQQQMEADIVTFNPDTVEALELLHALQRALVDRYGDRTTDLVARLNEVEEALAEVQE